MKELFTIYRHKKNYVNVNYNHKKVTSKSLKGNLPMHDFIKKTKLNKHKHVVTCNFTLCM